MQEVSTKGVIDRRVYSNKNTDIKLLEKEVEDLEKIRSKTEVNIEDTVEKEESDLPPEEKTYKKRYGDLRRHSQNQINEHKATITKLEERISELESELKKAGSTDGGSLPSTEEEFKQWASEYPNAAKVLKALARETIKEENEIVHRKIKELEIEKEETAKEKVLNKIRKKHPYFDDLSNDADFHDWLEVQPKVFQDSIYENSGDADAAIRVIDLFVQETGYGKPKDKKKANSSADSAKTVGTFKQAVEVEDNKYLFKESQIAKMSTNEFLKHYDAIEEARLNGKILYDVSAGAR